MIKNSPFLRKLIAMAMSVIGLGAVGGFAVAQRKKANEVERRAEEQRLRAKQAIDQLIREADRTKKAAE